MKCFHSTDSTSSSPLQWMEDPSARVLRAARDLLEATSHRDSDLYALTAVAEGPRILDASAATKTECVDELMNGVTWTFGPPRDAESPPAEHEVRKIRQTNGHHRRARQPPTGPPCVFCMQPTLGPGEDAFEFTGLHNPNVKHVACARCVFSSMLEAHPNPYTYAHVVALSYSK